MPFGLKNAAQTLQWLMDTVCQGLELVFSYINDVLFASFEEAAHKLHLRQLLDRFRDTALSLCGQMSVWPVLHRFF